jgi:hypothetical protein
MVIVKDCNYKMKKLKLKLSIEQQIQLLKDVKSDIIKNGTTGLCLAITKRLYIDHAVELYSIDYDDLKFYIKGFSIANAIRLSKKYNFDKPSTTTIYWWECREITQRIKFLDSLILELELLNK